MLLNDEHSSLRKLSETASALASLLEAKPKPSEFYERWLRAIVDSCVLTGARLRRPKADGTLGIVAAWQFVELSTIDVEVESDADFRRYHQLVLEVFSTGRPKVVPSRSELGSHADANPTPGVLMLASFVLDGEPRGLVELLLSATPSTDEFHELLACLNAAMGAAADFERGRAKDSLQARQAMIDEVERFTRTVHENLSVKHVAYAAANEGRRLIDCDRASILIRRGNRWTLTTVSGLEVVEPRAQASRCLAKLAAIVGEAGEAVWYGGKIEELSPQVGKAIGEYVDQSHVRVLGIIPLCRPFDEAKGGKRPRPLGALIVEQLTDSIDPTEPDDPARRERARLVALHTTASLSNALEHEAIPLLGIWRFAGRIKKVFAPGTRIKTAAIALLLIAFSAGMKFLPAELTVNAKGILLPAIRQHCFAPLDGTVQAIHVRHGDRVKAGQVLAELRNTDLDVALADCLGQRMAAADQQLSTERALFEDGAKLAAGERHRLAGQRNELKQKITSLDEQLRLLRSKKELLKVVSPIAGEVTTWNVEQLLANRPVRQGQILIDVADTLGPWELELQVPENSVAHLLRARNTGTDSLRVAYRLASAPEEDRAAAVEEVQYAAEVRGDQGNTVLVRASLPGTVAADVRPGAEASAKVYCGPRALGYVWLHDAVDFVHSKVLFRLY